MWTTPRGLHHALGPSIVPILSSSDSPHRRTLNYCNLPTNNYYCQRDFILSLPFLTVITTLVAQNTRHHAILISLTISSHSFSVHNHYNHSASYRSLKIVIRNADPSCANRGQSKWGFVCLHVIFALTLLKRFGVDANVSSWHSVGDDGPWSSFLIDVGSPPQQVQVLVSTEVSSTWVVAPGGCGPSYPANCTGARGGAYDSTKSSTWNANALYTLNAETNLGNPYSASNQVGSYGYDTIMVPGQGEVANVSVDHQVIAAIATNTYYLGNLGLSSQNITFTADGGNTSPSFLGSLRNENLIPSLSFGYTAGASYRKAASNLMGFRCLLLTGQNGTTGSLTLGGYDASRFIPNDVSFTFAPQATRQLVVGLQSVTYSNSTTQTSLLSPGINTLVDSTVPYLWLPESTCDAFQEAFGLTLDPIHNLYTVNESSHAANLKQNASIVFQLANSLTGGGPSINITLPYASFDLVATAPLVSNQTRYFPLQRGNDDTQYTLGRTFLQESYVISR